MSYRGSAGLAALAALSFAPAARATDKAECAAAAEAGQRLAKDHKYVAAREKLLVCASKDCPDVIVQDCTQWLGETERNVASVVFKPVDDAGHRLDGVQVTEHGVVVTEHASDGAVDVDPGAHVYRFQHGGYEPVEQRAQLDEGRRNQEIAVTLHAAPVVVAPPVVPEHAASRGVPVLVAAIATTGLAVLGGGFYAGFGLSGMSDQNDLKKTCAPYCTSAQTAPVQTKFTIANVALVGGLVALATAGVLSIVWATTKTPEKHVSLSGVSIAF